MGVQFPVRPDPHPAQARYYLAAGRIVASTLPGGDAPAAADVDELARAAAGPSPATWTERSTVALTGLLLALTRVGGIDRALALIDEHFDGRELRLPTTAHETSVMALLSAVAEVYAAAGWPQRAVLFAGRALAYAERAGDRPAEYRALSLLALGRSINGEYAAAERGLARCRELETAYGWSPSAATYPLLLGRILVASARFDMPELERITTVLRSTRPHDATWEVTAKATEGMALLLRREINRGLPLILEVINGGDRDTTFSMVQGFALGLYADLLLSRGDARRVLSVLEGRVSPPGHALCVDMQRSAALLLLGRDREALTVTDPCIRLGTDHCLRTIPPLLFRRAIALARLGHRREADDTFEEAFHLITASGSTTPLLTLPAAEIEVLLDRLAERRPESGADVEAVRTRLAGVPAVDVERPQLPALTRQEERLALHLRGPLTLPQLAAEWFVSANTLKSQSRTLYAKLGVARRTEAVAVLERAGYYD